MTWPSNRWPWLCFNCVVNTPFFCLFLLIFCLIFTIPPTLIRPPSVGRWRQRCRDQKTINSCGRRRRRRWRGGQMPRRWKEAEVTHVLLRAVVNDDDDGHHRRCRHHRKSPDIVVKWMHNRRCWSLDFNDFISHSQYDMARLHNTSAFAFSVMLSVISL